MTRRPSPYRSSADAFPRAVRAFERGKLSKAAALCEETLAVAPDHFDALHLLGVVTSRLGRPEAALSFFNKALLIAPENADLHNNCGSALADLGRFEPALASYDQALAGRPDLASAYNNRGCVLMFMERFDDALVAYGRALMLAPDEPEFMNNMGRALTRLLRYDDALDCFDDAIAQRPDFTDAMLNRGRVFEELRCHDDAVAAYDAAMKAGADKATALLRRAGALQGATRYDAALAEYDRVERITPQNNDALLGRGSALAHLGRKDPSLACFDEAARRGVDPAAVLLARCIALGKLELPDAAMETARELVALAPTDAAAQNALGLGLMNAERFEEAIACFETALQYRRHYPLVEWNLGYLLLLHGRFIEGFRHYEARRRQEGTRWTRLDGPEWRRGLSLPGKRLLLYAEQAFGDTIHFARYAGVFADMGATVIFGVYAPLAVLMAQARGVAEVTLADERTPPYDLHLPLMSAPYVLGEDEADIQGRPYIVADQQRIAGWAGRLPAGRLRVGIAWQGSKSIPGRAVPLVAFAPLAAIPGVSLISLQKTDGLDQMATLPAGLRIETLGPDFDHGADAFLDTAAVMMSLDLIVSVDTAIAHLAGALGCPVWIVLKTVPDWRWMLDRENSPWYPTARLFRRKKGEEWEQTMQGVAVELAKWADAGKQ